VRWLAITQLRHLNAKLGLDILNHIMTGDSDRPGTRISWLVVKNEVVQFMMLPYFSGAFDVNAVMGTSSELHR
jgi:hypothetical protein